MVVPVPGLVALTVVASLRPSRSALTAASSSLPPVSAAELKLIAEPSTHPDIDASCGLVAGVREVVPGGASSADVGTDRAGVGGEDANVEVDPVERVDCVGELRNRVFGHLSCD